MELSPKHSETELPETPMAKPAFEFDPDRLIEPVGVRPESELSDPDYVAKKVEGLGETEQETRILENGNALYDSPIETGELLNSDQGNAVPGFQGDCGLVSCENVARLARKDVTEADAVKIARDGGLCLDGYDSPEDNGATTFLGICEVLSRLGIEPALLFEPDAESIADAVESGRGVIAGVEVSEFWENYPYEGYHAITITNVERDPTGNPVAFYVCDSGSGNGDFARRVDAATMERSLDGDPVVMTEMPIR